MNRNIYCVLIFLTFSLSFGQKKSPLFRSKTIVVASDTIQIDSVSINRTYFSVLDSVKKPINTNFYDVDFGKSKLILKSEKHRKITIEYFCYPDFLTKTYAEFDKKLILPSTKYSGKLYSLTTNKTKERKLFHGLNTKGFIVRGLTSGNNQNAVTNSSLDLTIEGKLSKNVAIKANIFDTNLPLQENGYSKNITEFDRIFIELYGKKWKLKGGDIALSNNETSFLRFEKQIAGVQAQATPNNTFNVMASGALVKGKFSAYNFTATEGNQGPYKILGANNEKGIIIIAGSERVFVNGIEVEAGANNAYTIDYNLAEIQFNTTFPVTNNMRIRIEFQFADNNYARFITYDYAKYHSKKLDINAFFYSENDAKNQPLQQSLNKDQKEILSKAGNDPSKMIVQSAVKSPFSEDKILYKKINNYFEYSTNTNDTLYTVNFLNVGKNKGNYTPDKNTAIGTIYKYVGENLGDFKPEIQLIAPSSIQVAVLKSNYKPSQNTNIQSEIAYSNNDNNLFSEIDNQKNKKAATQIEWTQKWLAKKWNFFSNLQYKFVEEGFKSVQRFQEVEFNRNWNINTEKGNLHQLKTTLFLERNKKDSIGYRFEQLRYTNNYLGNKHSIWSILHVKKTFLSLKSSILNNSSLNYKNVFWKNNVGIEHRFEKKWLGAKMTLESNEKVNTDTQQKDTLSHRFKTYESYFGIGDTTTVFAKIGGIYTENDSIKENRFTEINNRKTIYLNSKLIASKKTNLALFANYQFTTNRFANNEKTLNTKIVYQQNMFNQFLNLSTLYQTSSGNIARQNYVYLKTEPGQGFYTWIDYNNNQTQEYNEFEIAKFQDQANYLRVALPNISYVPTNTVRFKQSLAINPFKWSSSKQKIKKFISHFYNQTHLTTYTENERTQNSFSFNPFGFKDQNLIQLQYNFRNSLYFNRSLNYFSFEYSYGKSNNKQQFLIERQKNTTENHSLSFQHSIKQHWLLEISANTALNKLNSDNLTNRNYNLNSKKINPKISYHYNDKHTFSGWYAYLKKINTIKNFEELQQQEIGLSYVFKGQKENQINADFKSYINNFKGSENSPTAYQMLQGLQKGKNYTWSLVANQRLNSLLVLSLSYFGRKSNSSKTIHTGSVQLKAIF